MTEDAFNLLIGCAFPYRDADVARRLIDLGRSLSPNAHFMTLEEICRPPARAAVTAAEQFVLMRDCDDVEDRADARSNQIKSDWIRRRGLT